MKSTSFTIGIGNEIEIEKCWKKNIEKKIEQSKITNDEWAN